MKKVVLFIAVVSAFAFASCKKDRTCTCTTTSTAPGSIPYTTVTTFTKAKKRDSKSQCLTVSSTEGGYTWKSTCELK